MVMQYFNQIKNRRRSSQVLSPPKPVLTDEDEAFLQKVTSDPEHALKSAGQNETQGSEGLPEGPEGSQAPAVDETALDVPLPTSPVEAFGKELGEEERKTRDQPGDTRTKSEPTKARDDSVPEKKKRWSGTFWKKSSDTKKVCSPILQGCSFQLASPVLISEIVFIEQGSVSHRQIQVQRDQCPIHHSSCSGQRRSSAKGPRRHDRYLGTFESSCR